MEVGASPLPRGAAGAQLLKHRLSCSQGLPRGVRHELLGRRQPGLINEERHCQRWACHAESPDSEERASAVEADTEAAAEDEAEAESKTKSFWDVFRPEPEPKPLLPEQSKLIGREIYLLVLQQNIDQQVQRALNMDNFDLAKILREDRQALDDDLQQLEAEKGRGSGAGSTSRGGGAELASKGIRLRAELQQAIEQEQYKDAARVRDELKEMQAGLDAQKAEEESWRRDLPDERRFRLGQRVTHERGFQGTVAGWDLCCCEGEEWHSGLHERQDERGTKQPYYHLLLDIATLGQLDRQSLKGASITNFTAYVPEDSLAAPAEESSWLEEEGDGPLMHPWANVLFYGQDARGDLIPTQRLRDRYSQERRDVSSKEEPEDEGGPGDDDPPSSPPGFPGGSSGSGWDLPDTNFPSGGTSFAP